MAGETTTVYTARRVITMDPDMPSATAVAVSGNRIAAVSDTDDLRSAGVLDDTFADAVICPGLIDQHLHPVLGATTLMTEVIAVEDWSLPDRTYPAARSAQEYRDRLTAAHRALAPGEWLFSWGYHKLWHGPLDRAALDAISTTRPIVVWQRSCHEWFLNTAAIDALGLTAADMAGRGPASEMVDFAAGHWWETGMNLLLPSLSPVFMSPQRLTAGLKQLVEYLHRNGVTAINEPGIMWDVEPWPLYQQILGAAETPFSSTFLVDARSQADSGMDPADAVADAEEQVARASTGKVRLLPKQVKLFADGAIISQLMQMREPYLDDAGHPDLCHHGEWMMQPDAFRAFARVYWDAGWQLHIHVNGDAGLDLVLDTIEECMAAHPRTDHRTVIVHFANSSEEQIDRIARLGCIVSANPYYPVGFADQYARARTGARARRHHGAGGLGAAPRHPAVAAFRPADGTGRAADAGLVRGEPADAQRPHGRTGAADLGARRAAGGDHRGRLLVADGRRTRQHHPGQAGELHGAGRGSLHGGSAAAQGHRRSWAPCTKGRPHWLPADAAQEDVQCLFDVGGADGAVGEQHVGIDGTGQHDRRAQRVDSVAQFAAFGSTPKRHRPGREPVVPEVSLHAGRIEVPVQGQHRAELSSTFGRRGDGDCRLHRECEVTAQRAGVGYRDGRLRTGEHRVHQQYPAIVPKRFDHTGIDACPRSDAVEIETVDTRDDQLVKSGLQDDPAHFARRCFVRAGRRSDQSWT